MSNPKRIKSKKTGKSGWEFRFTDPATGGRTHKTFWLPERREAERAFAEHMATREAVRIGLPDNSGWQMSYRDLVERFVQEAPISSAKRREDLRGWLLRNELSLRLARDLCNVSQLGAGCVRLLKSRSDEYVRKRVQKPLKQMSAWAASVKILPVNPLADWPLIQRTSEVDSKRALLPQEMRALLEATQELDALYGRRYPLSLVLKVLLLTGNRPSAVFSATVGDLADGRICLPPGSGGKRNGTAHLPEEFMAEMEEYLQNRRAQPGDALLVSPRGMSLSRVNLRNDFLEAATLAFVRMIWPENAGDVEPLEVSTLIVRGKPRGSPGAQPRDPKMIAARNHHIQRIEDVARSLEPQVRKMLEGVTLYSLKHTHITWARRLVSPDSVRVQVGHAAQDIQERHYLDVRLVNPKESAEAVWDVLNGRRNLSGGYLSQPMKKAAGAEVESAHLDPEMANEVDLNVDLTPIPMGLSMGRTGSHPAFRGLFVNHDVRPLGPDVTESDVTEAEQNGTED